MSPRIAAAGNWREIASDGNPSKVGWCIVCFKEVLHQLSFSSIPLTLSLWNGEKWSISNAVTHWVPVYPPLGMLRVLPSRTHEADELGTLSGDGGNWPYLDLGKP